MAIDTRGPIRNGGNLTDWSEDHGTSLVRPVVTSVHKNMYLAWSLGTEERAAGTVLELHTNLALTAAGLGSIDLRFRSGFIRTWKL
jgi:hypothetical protein